MHRKHLTAEVHYTTDLGVVPKHKQLTVGQENIDQSVVDACFKITINNKWNSIIMNTYTLVTFIVVMNLNVIYLAGTSFCYSMER